MKTVRLDNLYFTVEDDDLVVRWFETEVGRTPVADGIIRAADIKRLVEYAALTDYTPE